jgi:hypothetical protein
MKRYRNIFLTFLASGLWHGAGMNYIAWGALHGLFIIGGLATGKFRDAASGRLRLDRLPRLKAALGTLGTGTLVCFAWIFFRAESLAVAFTLVRRIGSGTLDFMAALVSGNVPFLKKVTDIAHKNVILGFSRDTYRPEMLILFLSLCGFWLMSRKGPSADVIETLSGKGPVARWLIYALLIVVILCFGMFTQEQFIYFRF